MSFCQVIYFYYVCTSTGYGEYFIKEAVYQYFLKFYIAVLLHFNFIFIGYTDYICYTEYTSSMYVCRDLCQSQWYDTLWCFTAFAVLKYGCVAGIMVTVSHNPKQNNGYKLYWDNRAQVGDMHCT